MDSRYIHIWTDVPIRACSIAENYKTPLHSVWVSLSRGLYSEMSLNPHPCQPEESYTPGILLSSKKSFLRKLTEKKKHVDTDVFWYSLHDIGHSK